jgi:hypothetical protein
MGHSTDGGGPGNDEPSLRGGGVAATVEARQVKKLRLTRTARGAVIALMLALVVAAPAAAAQPIKTTNTDFQPFTIPADTACPFDVEGQPDFGFSMGWSFSDGVLKGSMHAHGAYVNAETDARYPTVEDYSFVQWTDSVSGNTYVVLDGHAGDSFLPGDTGPFGTVGAHGAFYDFVGRIAFTIDANGATTEFSWKGTATDICAAIS